MIVLGCSAPIMQNEVCFSDNNTTNRPTWTERIERSAADNGLTPQAINSATTTYYHGPFDRVRTTKGLTEHFLILKGPVCVKKRRSYSILSETRGESKSGILFWAVGNVTVGNVTVEDERCDDGRG